MKRFKVLLGQRRMQVLLVMAVLLLAVSVAVTSSASFTAQSANPGNVFTAGDLTLGNDKEGAPVVVMAPGPMMPGDIASGTVQITNTGGGSGVIQLDMTNIADTINLPGTNPLSETLFLHIEDETGFVVYDGDLDAWAGPYSCGPAFAAAQAHTYTFDVTFPDSDLGSMPATAGSDNIYKNCSTMVDFVWTAVSN